MGAVAEYHVQTRHHLPLVCWWAEDLILGVFVEVRENVTPCELKTHRLRGSARQRFPPAPLRAANTMGPFANRSALIQLHDREAKLDRDSQKPAVRSIEVVAASAVNERLVLNVCLADIVQFAHRNFAHSTEVDGECCLCLL